MVKFAGQVILNWKRMPDKIGGYSCDLQHRLSVKTMDM